MGKIRRFWAWLSESRNLKTIALLVVVLGSVGTGVWQVFVHFFPAKSSAPPPQVIEQFKERSSFRNILEDLVSAGASCSEADLERIGEIDAKEYLRDKLKLFIAYQRFVVKCKDSYEAQGSIESARLLDRFDDLFRERALSVPYVNNNMLDHYLLRILLENVPGSTMEREWERLVAYAEGTKRFFGPALATSSLIVAATKQGRPIDEYLEPVRRDPATCAEVRRRLESRLGLIQIIDEKLGEEGKLVFSKPLEEIEKICPQ